MAEDDVDASEHASRPEAGQPAAALARPRRERAAHQRRPLGRWRRGRARLGRAEQRAQRADALARLSRAGVEPRPALDATYAYLHASSGRFAAAGIVGALRILVTHESSMRKAGW